MKIKAPLATAVAIAAGLAVLPAYFFLPEKLHYLQSILLNWAVTLLGVAALVGVMHLLGVHWRRLGAKKERDYYSIFFLLAFVVTLAAGLWFTPADPIFQQFVLSIQVPIEASLLALLAVTLPVAVLRMLQRRRGVMPAVFLFSAVLFIVLRSGLLAWFINLNDYQAVLGVFNHLPLAGARGILLGVALGSLTAGLRVLFGAERPYSG